MTPDPLDLDAVEALCGAATTGPWSVRPIHFDNWGIIRSAMGNLVAVARAGDTSYRDRDHRLAGTDPFEHNAQFIAAARTLVPALVTRLRAAEAECARLRGDAERLEHMVIHGYALSSFTRDSVMHYRASMVHPWTTDWRAAIDAARTAGA